MKSFFNKLFGAKNSRPASIGRAARLNVEALEERSLMSAAPISPTLLAVTTQPPASVTAGSSFGLVVKAEDKFGDVASTYNGSVTLTLLTNPGGSVLSGVLTEKAVNGVASFSGLSLNKAGTGYELKATSGTLTSATTSGFKEVAAPTKVAASVVAKTPPGATPSGNVAPPVVKATPPIATPPGIVIRPMGAAKSPATPASGNTTAKAMNEVDDGYDYGDDSYDDPYYGYGYSTDVYGYSNYGYGGSVQYAGFGTTVSMGSNQLWNGASGWGIGTMIGWGVGVVVAPELTLPYMIWGGALGGAAGLWW